MPADPKEAYAWLEVATLEGSIFAGRDRDASFHDLSEADQKTAIARAQEILATIKKARYRQLNRQSRLGRETMCRRERCSGSWNRSEWAPSASGSRHTRGAKNLIDEDWEQLHRAFHVSLISACGSPLLLSFCQGLYNHFDRYRRIAVRTARGQPTITSVHAKLVETAIGKRIPEAVHLLTAHIQESEKEILRLAGARMFMLGDRAVKTVKTLSSTTTTKTKSKLRSRSRDS